MSLTPTQIDHVQRTFQLVAEDPATAAELFYGRLFEIAPEVRPMFKADISEQGRKLMQTLLVVVNNLHKLDNVIPAIAALGKRHAAYGVQDEQYAIVGAALLWTLATALKEEWTDDVAQAWTTAYTIVAETAIAGAREAMPDPQPL